MLIVVSCNHSATCFRSFQSASPRLHYCFSSIFQPQVYWDLPIPNTPYTEMDFLHPLLQCSGLLVSKFEWGRQERDRKKEGLESTSVAIVWECFHGKWEVQSLLSFVSTREHRECNCNSFVCEYNHDHNRFVLFCSSHHRSAKCRKPSFNWWNWWEKKKGGNSSNTPFISLENPDFLVSSWELETVHMLVSHVCVNPMCQLAI